jgi:hypothetical protein
MTIPTGNEIVEDQRGIPPVLLAEMRATLGIETADRTLKEMRAIGDGIWRAIGDRKVPQAAMLRITDAISLIVSANDEEILANSCGPMRETLTT